MAARVLPLLRMWPHDCYSPTRPGGARLQQSIYFVTKSLVWNGFHRCHTETAMQKKWRIFVLYRCEIFKEEVWAGDVGAGHRRFWDNPQTLWSPHTIWQLDFTVTKTELSVDFRLVGLLSMTRVSLLSVFDCGWMDGSVWCCECLSLFRVALQGLRIKETNEAQKPEFLFFLVVLSQEFFQVLPGAVVISMRSQSLVQENLPLPTFRRCTLHSRTVIFFCLWDKMR